MSSCSDNETLLYLVVRCRWSALASRAETHPDELEAVGDEDGMTVFHWACANDAPPRTLRALLLQDELRASQGHARAVLIPDFHGITPLMSACVRESSSEEIVKLLIESAPELIPLVDHDGWTALHFLCHNVRSSYAFAKSVLPLLLSRTAAENHELAFCRDTAGSCSPLSLVCDSFGVTQASLHTRDPGFTNVERDPVFCLLFVTCFLDLLHPPERRSWPLLCRLFSFSEIPLVFVDMVLLFRSHNLLEVNDDGDSPLHVAVSKPWEAGMLKRLVKERPASAALRNQRGMLPLQLALVTSNQHWNEDFLALLDANPASVEALEIDDAIYPYLLERIEKRPNALFGLLKSKPSLVRRTLH